MQRRILEERGHWGCLKRRFALVSGDSYVSDLYREIGFPNTVLVAQFGKALGASNYKSNDYMARVCVVWGGAEGVVFVWVVCGESAACGRLRGINHTARCPRPPLQATVWVKWRVVRSALRHFDNGGISSLPQYRTDHEVCGLPS